MSGYKEGVGICLECNEINSLCNGLCPGCSRLEGERQKKLMESITTRVEDMEKLREKLDGR